MVDLSLISQDAYAPCTCLHVAPLPLISHRYIANFISYFKLLAIALIVTGQNPFQMLGTDTPRVWSWGQENKVRDASVQDTERSSCVFLCLSVKPVLINVKNVEAKNGTRVQAERSYTYYYDACTCSSSRYCYENVSDTSSVNVSDCCV